MLILMRTKSCVSFLMQHHLLRTRVPSWFFFAKKCPRALPILISNSLIPKPSLLHGVTISLDSFLSSAVDEPCSTAPLISGNTWGPSSSPTSPALTSGNPHFPPRTTVLLTVSYGWGQMAIRYSSPGRYIQDPRWMSESAESTKSYIYYTHIPMMKFNL